MQMTRSDQRQQHGLSSAGLAIEVITPNSSNQAAAGREGSLREFTELLQTKNSQAVGNCRAPPRHTPKRWLQKQGVMRTDRQTGHRASWWGEEQEKREGKPETAPMSLPLIQELAEGRMFLHSLPWGCSVHPSWHSHMGSSAHHEPLLLFSTPKKAPYKVQALISFATAHGGLQQSWIFSELCSSGASWLRKMTPEWHAGGDGEVEGGLACSPRSAPLHCCVSQQSAQPWLSFPS